jgi:hypothetical protein
MQYTEQLLDRYSKVTRLAQGGLEGEKDNAIRQQTKMESKYPGINYQSQLRDRQQAEKQRPDLGPTDAAADTFGGAFQQDQRWKKWAGMAGNAFSWAAHVAGEAASVRYAQQCAEAFTEVQGKNLASAKYQIAVKLPLKDLYNCAKYLNPMQKQVFAHWVGQQVAQMVLSALEEDE